MKAIERSTVATAFLGMVLLLLAFPLLRIPIISLLGILAVLCALRLLGKTTNSLRNPEVAAITNLGGIIFIVFGGFTLLVNMWAALPSTNWLPLDFSGRFYGIALLTAILITSGIHLRAPLTIKQATLVFSYWYLFLPLEMLLIQAFSNMGLDMSGRN